MIPAESMAIPRSVFTTLTASAAAIDPANWPSWMERRPQPAIQPAGTPREASTGQSAHSTM